MQQTYHTYDINVMPILDEQQLKTILHDVDISRIVPFTKLVDEESLAHKIIFAIMNPEADWIMFAKIYEVNVDFLKDTPLDHLMKVWRAPDYVNWN